MNRATVFILAVSVSACGLWKKKPKPSPVNSDSQKELYYQAELAYINGNYNEAKGLFLKFTKESPKPGSGYYRLACINKLEKKYDEAIYYCDLAIKADPKDQYYYSVLKAETYRANRDYSHAAAIFDDLSRQNPQYWSLYTDAANMYKSSGNATQLLNFTRRWESIFGIREEIAFFTSYAYSMKGNNDSIAWVYQKLAAKYPERRQYKISYARALQDAGKTEQAITVYNELLDTDPENAELLSNLCRFYESEAKEKDHWKLVQRVVASHSMNLEDKQVCIQSFLEPNNAYFDSMGPLLQTLVSMHPNNSISWQILGDWTYAGRKFAAAANPLHESLVRFSNYNTWLKLADCHLQLENFSALGAICDSMLELFPSNPNVYDLQAQALLGLKKTRQAREACETGLSYVVEEHNKVNLNITMARIMNVSGEKTEAYAMLKKLVTENPADYLPLITLAELYTENNDQYSEIPGMLEKAVKLCTGSADVTDALSVCNLVNVNYWINNKNYTAAKKALDVLLLTDPNNYKAWAKLGEIADKEGQAQDAKKYYEKAFLLNPTHPDLKRKISTL